MAKKANLNEFGTEDQPLVVKPEKPYEKPKELIRWKAHGRVFKNRDPLWFLSLLVLAGLATVVLLLLQQWTLILATIAVAFVLVATNLVAPNDQEYVVTTMGIKVGEREYGYQDLKWFWFDRNDEYKLLNISTYLDFPHILQIPMPYAKTEEFMNQLEEKLLKYLPYHEEKQRDLFVYLDRVITRLQPYLPKQLVNWYSSKVRM